jgi:hypothetical protein
MLIIDAHLFRQSQQQLHSILIPRGGCIRELTINNHLLSFILSSVSTPHVQSQYFTTLLNSYFRNSGPGYPARFIHRRAESDRASGQVYDPQRQFSSASHSQPITQDYCQRKNISPLSSSPVCYIIQSKCNHLQSPAEISGQPE